MKITLTFFILASLLTSPATALENGLRLARRALIASDDACGDQPYNLYMDLLDGDIGALVAFRQDSALDPSCPELFLIKDNLFYEAATTDDLGIFTSVNARVFYMLFERVPYSDMKTAASLASGSRASAIRSVYKNFGYYAKTFISHLGKQGYILSTFDKEYIVSGVLHRDLLAKEDGYYIRSLWKYETWTTAMLERQILQNGIQAQVMYPEDCAPNKFDANCWNTKYRLPDDGMLSVTMSSSELSDEEKDDMFAFWLSAVFTDWMP